jgi:hypothetical protein
MKSRFVRVSLLSAVVLVTPLLTFAGGQPKIQPLSKVAAPDRTGITRSINQGKGAGMTVFQGVIRPNAYREQTAEDRPATQVQTVTGNPKLGDPAFTK